MLLTPRQRAAVKKVYDRIPTPLESYLSFRRSKVSPGWSGEIMVPFAGMVLGIERDGYTHS